MILPTALARILAQALPGTRYRVTGDSMAPTLFDGQQVLAAPLPPAGRPFQRGTVVVLRHPLLPGEIYVKRIVGLPGESLRIDGGRVYVDGCLLPEPYLEPEAGEDGAGAPRRATAKLWETDAGEYFVMGDRRNDSQDSRSFGPVRREQILGRVWLRCWPPHAWGTLASP